jgi:hypothetical protein
LVNDDRQGLGSAFQRSPELEGSIPERLDHRLLAIASQLDQITTAEK